jgi:hypothetical protein
MIMKKLFLFLFFFLFFVCDGVVAQRKVVSSSVSNLSNGNIVEKIEYNDGTVTYKTKKKCIHCRGKKRCTRCGGTGFRIIGHGIYAMRVGCSICDTRGTCGKCNNEGMNVISTSYDPKTGAHTIVDEVTGSVHISYSGADIGGGYSPSSGNSGSGSGKKNVSSCTGCNGCGKICVDVPGTLGDIYYCSFCGHKGYGKHTQRPCYQCGGHGSY